MSEKDERYEYCWEGCYDEENDYIVKTEIIIVDGEKVVHCPKCGRNWPLDWVQIKGTPHQFKQRSISKYIRDKEENPQDFWPDDDIQGGN